MKQLQLAFATLALLIASAIPAASDSRKQISPCRVTYPSDQTIEWECRSLRKKETPETQFGDLWQDVLRFNRIDRRHIYPGFRFKFPKNPAVIAGFTPLPATLPKVSDEPKFILVDLSEQFLGAYEFGRLVRSFPIASGGGKNKTPTGEFRITAFSKNHASSLYKIEKTKIPYPMHYAIRFLISSSDVAFWIHGRDLPGYPASHGCVGLYDEEMQKKYYQSPDMPLLEDARTLYEWVLGPTPDDGTLTTLKDGPKVSIVGKAPR